MSAIPPNDNPQTVPLSWTDKFIFLYPQATRLRFANALRVEGDLPARDDLHDLITAAIARVPALSYQVAGRRWRTHFALCADVDPARHVEFVNAPAGRDPALCMLDALRRPFPAGQPPWSLQVVSGYGTGEYLLVYRVCHRLQDGVAAALTAQAMLTGLTLPAPQLQPPREPFTMSSLRAGARILPRFRHRPARWLPKGEPGPDPVVHSALLDRAIFDEITRHTGASTAQICLAVLGGALRMWAPQHWEGPIGRKQRGGLPICMTLGLRQPRDRNTLGNRIGMVPVTLPCADASPARRLRTIMERTDCAELSQYRRFLTALLPDRSVLGWPLARLLHAIRPPRPVATIVPFGMDASSFGARELLSVPPQPDDIPGGFIFVSQPSSVSAFAAFHAAIPGSDRLPDLFVEALDQLRTSVTASAHRTADEPRAAEDQSAAAVGGLVPAGMAASSDPVQVVPAACGETS